MTYTSVRGAEVAGRGSSSPTENGLGRGVGQPAAPPCNFPTFEGGYLPAQATARRGIKNPSLDIIVLYVRGCSGGFVFLTQRPLCVWSEFAKIAPRHACMMPSFNLTAAYRRQVPPDSRPLPTFVQTGSGRPGSSKFPCSTQDPTPTCPPRLHNA